MHVGSARCGMELGREGKRAGWGLGASSPHCHHSAFQGRYLRGLRFPN